MSYLVDPLRSALIDPAALAAAAAFSVLLLTGSAARIIDFVERRPGPLSRGTARRDTP
jgi:hypothetical protein